MDCYFDSDTRIRLLGGWQVPFPSYTLKQFQNLLVHGKLEDLRRLYTVTVCVCWELDPVRTQFGENVKEAGANSVLKLIGKGTVGADGIDLGTCMDALFAVHQQYWRWLWNVLWGRLGFLSVLMKPARSS